MKDILKDLGIEAENAGTWLGSESSSDASGALIESINPTTGEVIATVRSTTAAEYERVVTEAREAFLEWRMIPAPVRGAAGGANIE